MARSPWLGSEPLIGCLAQILRNIFVSECGDMENGRKFVQCDSYYLFAGMYVAA